jgi:preprotein translocase subunit SecG
MLLLLTIVHIIVAVLLVFFVLIQDSKGDGVFGMGGGGSNQVLSSTGAANFLVKATRVLAVVFAITSIALTYITSKHSRSVVDDYVPAKAAAPAPAPTGTAAPAAAATPAAPTAPTAAQPEGKK